MRHKPTVAFILALAACLAAYWIGLSGPLVFDDAMNLAPVGQWLSGEIDWRQVVFGNESGRFGRPVSMASFVLNASLLGPEIVGFKAANLALHLANGALVYWLLTLISKQTTPLDRSSPVTRWLPCLVAAVWLLHPLMVSTVLYVVQRMAMLSAFFMLLGMVSFVLGRTAMMRAEPRRAAALLLLALPAFTLLATFSKENGVLTLALCGIIELFLFAPVAGNRRHAFSKLLIAITLALPALIAIGLIVFQASAVTDGYANRSFTLIERLLTQSRILWDYIGSLLLPVGLRLSLYHDDFIISRGLVEPASTLVAIVAWLIVLGSVWRLREKVPGYSLGVGIFLVAHSLESSIFPLLLYFEHRNYLPSVGLLWAFFSLLAALGPAIASQMDNAGRIFAIASVALVVVLGLATAGRAGVWQSQQALLIQGLAHHPDSRWLRMDLVSAAMSEQPPDVDSAVIHSGHLMASEQRSTQRLGALLTISLRCSQGVPPSTEARTLAFDGKPEPIEPDLLVAFEALSNGVATQPCPELAPPDMAERLDALVSRSALPASDQNIWRLRFAAAKLYLANGETENALKQARLARSGGTSDAPVSLLIVGLLINLGETTEATQLLDVIEPDVSKGSQRGQSVIREYREALRQKNGPNSDVQDGTTPHGFERGHD